MDAPYFIASRGIGRAATLSRVVPPYTILHGIPFARATAAVMGACGEWMLQYVSRLLWSFLTLFTSITHCRSFPPFTSPGPNGA